jgi:hypothetical protein
MGRPLIRLFKSEFNMSAAVSMYQKPVKLKEKEAVAEKESTTTSLTTGWADDYR